MHLYGKKNMVKEMKTLYRGSGYELDARQEKVMIYKDMHSICNQPYCTPLGHIHLTTTPAAGQKQENRKRGKTEILYVRIIEIIFYF